MDPDVLSLAEFAMLSGAIMSQHEPPMARTVLRYFSRYPRAADTLEGIARWRLLEEQVQRITGDVRTALEWLIAQGYLKEDARPYSGSIYSLNETQREEIERFLKEEKEE